MISFRNEGLINLDAIKTFGVSSKSGDSPIGYFGTGLKYAIAIILKNGGAITIYRGKRAYRFGVKRKKIRNDRFDIITMNDKELGFTTHMGSTWEPWQAFRELYCNTLDEVGQVTSSALKPEAGYTTIQVSKFPAFEKAYSERDQIVLTEAPWKTLRTITGGIIEVHRRESAHVYYRGIRAMTLEKPSRFTYNMIEDLDLTEDRTVKNAYVVLSRIRDGATASQDEEYLGEWLTAPEGYLEHAIDLNGSFLASDVLLDTISQLARELNEHLNPSAQKLLAAHRGHIDTYKDADLNGYEMDVLGRAVEIAHSTGHQITKYNIRVVDTLGAGVLGRAYRKEILLAKRCFIIGDRCVLGTLLEEFIHLEHGLHDETRPFQDYLIDLIAQLAERNFNGHSMPSHSGSTIIPSMDQVFKVSGK